MTGPLPAPGRTAVRTSGDHFQWLHVWRACVNALRDARTGTPNPVTAVGVEVDGAGNVDDLVLYRRHPPHTYAQVKYAVDSTSPVSTVFLTAASGAKGPSVLQKIHRAHQHLIATGDAVDLALVSNRTVDPADVLVAGRDSRTGYLLPNAGQQGPTSARGKARKAWADHLGIDNAELLDLLGVLRFDLSWDLARLIETTSATMLAAGLLGDDASVRAGADWVAEQVQAGTRRLDVAAIERGTAERRLQRGRAWCSVSVATLVPDPAATDAVVALDWVDRFEGANAAAKRRPAPPNTWAQLQEEFEALPARLTGQSGVLITGTLRQATAFTLGAALRMVTGFDVSVAQRGQLWASDDNLPTSPYELTARSEHISEEPDVAVVIQVATRIQEDVRPYLEQHCPTVGRMLVLSPTGGPNDRAVPDSSTANAMALAARDAARTATRSGCSVHLFLGGPLGLALLLGHRWNAVAATTVYEDLRTEGYAAAFRVPA